MATGTGMLLNKRFNEQNNGCACALQFLVHFFTILYKTSTRNVQILHCVENVKHETANCFEFLFQASLFPCRIQFRDRFDSDKQSHSYSVIVRADEGSSEKNCCWLLTFQQPERKSSSESSE